MEDRIYTADFLKMEENMVVSSNGVRISMKRRSGNTTRIINNAIQQLFDGKKVAVKNYPDSKKIEDAEFLCEKIMKRLRLEHVEIVPYIKKQKIRHLLFMWIDDKFYNW